MSNTEELYARWLEAKTEELAAAAQTMLRSEDPEAAIRAALGHKPGDVLEAFADKVTTPEPDGPYLEELGRRVTRAEAQSLLAAWRGPLSPTFRAESSEAVATEMSTELDRINEEHRTHEATRDRQLAEWQAEWSKNNLNRI